ncbi:Cation channel sperm-associated protein subunit gamma 2, partial [Orchesella cincta]
MLQRRAILFLCEIPIDSTLSWACHTLSPCARIAPRSTLETVYYFEVLITNEGVDNDTLCLFEKKFIILLYGFPPSPEVQLMTTVFFYIMMIAVLYILYFCLRGHKKLWRSTNMKLYGWFQIVKDTLPKSWTKSDEN